MSLAPTKRPPPAEPSFDLDYSVHDFEVSPHRDSQFLIRRAEDALYREASVKGGRTLDVACGVGRLAARLRERGSESWGLEPSLEMIGVSRWLFPPEQVVLVRAIAEALPFRDGSFDRVVCQGSLDHFVDPHAFMREAARVLRPGGRTIIALANYASLSCRLGRLLQRLGRGLLRRAQPAHRPYWQPPPDHHHTGELPFVRRLGGSGLRLERCYGVSLFWLLPGWGRRLDHLPGFLADTLLAALDRIAYRTPALADMIISVWQPRRAHDVGP